MMREPNWMPLRKKIVLHGGFVLLLRLHKFDDGKYPKVLEILRYDTDGREIFVTSRTAWKVPLIT